MKAKVFFLLATAVLFATTSCKHTHSEDEHGAEEHESHKHENEIIFTQAQSKACGLKTETVKPSTFSEILHVSGQIMPAPGDEATVTATSDGIVNLNAKLAVPGATVSKGSMIATVSAKNLASGDPVTKARIAYETAKKEFERAEKLVKDKIISDKEYELLRSQYEEALTNYKAQSNNHTSSGIGVQSPLSGFIKNILVAEGDYVSTGQAIATVSQNRRLVLRADVPEKEASKRHDIADANFILSSDSKRIYNVKALNGRLVSYGKNIDAQSFFIPVTFEIDNTEDLIPGAYADIYLTGRQLTDVISLPKEAITEEQDLYFVYLQIGKEVFKKQEVTIGSTDGKRTEILSGLKAGDKAVVSGAYQVKLASLSGAIPEGHSHSH